MFHVKHEKLESPGRRSSGAGSAIKNLVGPGTLTDVWTRHIADSLQLLGPGADGDELGSTLAPAPDFLGWSSPSPAPRAACAAVHLVESNARKCASCATSPG